MKTGLIKAGLIAAASLFALGGPAQAQDIYSMVSAANAQLAADGKNYRIGMAEYITNLESDQAGRTLLFSNRGNRHLAFDFVPGDPRRAGWSGPGTNITYITDDTEQSADPVNTLGAIDGAMATWEAVQCSTIPITDRGETGVEIGVVQFLLPGLVAGGPGFGFYGGNPNLVGADIGHLGFLPPGFFQLLGSSNILGVTFTLIFVDGAGNPTDIDNNRYGDVAFREIYYNDGFTWENDPNDIPGDARFDIQTVALHEAGHGLSQGHFGAVFETGTPPNVRRHFAPLAVMNAGYIFGQQQLAGTDNGGHCSNWASWPNN